MNRVMAAAIVAAHCLAPATAGAQSRVTFIPSVSIGAVYDDNLFAQIDGSAGQLLQVRPSFEGNYESPRLTLLGLYSFDMQRANFSLLNTLDARRHAMGDMKFRTSPMTTVGLTGRYDRSEVPGDLDIDTGILGDRRQAERVQFTPSVMHRLSTRSFYTASYDFTTENLIEDARGTLHAGRFGYSRETSTRTVLTGSYLGRLFVDGLEDHWSHAVLGAWTREMAPGTRVSLAAGPRITSYRGIAPEVSAGFGRTTPRVRLALDYWHGETIVLGIRGPVAVDSAAARITWPLTRTIEFGTHAGVSDVLSLDDRNARIYRGTLVSSWSPGGGFTLAGSYGIDYQLGEIRPPACACGVDDGFPADDRVLRHVFRVSVTIAPRLSRSILPPEEAARAKGVTR